MRPISGSLCIKAQQHTCEILIVRGHRLGDLGGIVSQRIVQGQIHKPIARRYELAKLHSRLFENCSSLYTFSIDVAGVRMTYLNVHAVRLTVYDFGDTDLRDLDATGQARTSGKRISLSP